MKFWNYIILRCIPLISPKLRSAEETNREIFRLPSILFAAPRPFAASNKMGRKKDVFFHSLLFAGAGRGLGMMTSANGFPGSRTVVTRLAGPGCGGAPIPTPGLPPPLPSVSACVFYFAKIREFLLFKRKRRSPF